MPLPLPARIRTLAIVSLLLAYAACRGDLATAPPPTALAEAAPAFAHGPVGVTEVLDLGEPTEGGPYGLVRAEAVNERGQVAVFGSGNRESVPLLWEAGAFRRLLAPSPTVPGPLRSLAALNAAGVGAGVVFGPNRVQGALFTGGTPVLLPDGPGELRGGSLAFGIDDAGDVVGLRAVRLPGFPDFVDRATLWRRGGAEVVDLGALTATGVSRAFALNNRGQAVGQSAPAGSVARPVFFADGRVVALELPSGYVGGEARAINERGQAAGVVSGPAGTRAAFWDQNGRVLVLEPPAGERSSIARGINDAGDVVGAVFSPPAGPGRPATQSAALWRGGAVTVLPHLPGPAGLALATDVNNRGEAVGFDQGGRRAVRWTVSPAAPVPDVPPGPNRAPEVRGLRPDPAQGPYRLAANACGGRFTVCVRFTVADADGDADAPFRVVVDWGDGTPWTPNELTRSGVPALAPHGYRAPGTYAVRVTATDRRGAASTATLTLAVVP